MEAVRWLAEPPSEVLIDGHAVQLQPSQRGASTKSRSSGNVKKSKSQGSVFLWMKREV